MGYHNGAESGTLDDDAVPNADAGPSGILARLHTELGRRLEIRTSAILKLGPHQLTVTPNLPIGIHELWELVQGAAFDLAGSAVRVARSSHSVDIVECGISKMTTARLLQQRLPPSVATLTIGDKGAWPGNDYALLAKAHSLSVDECSLDPNSCWNLAPVGQRGVAATIAYLRALRVTHSGGAHFAEGAFQ
jgi:hypothetical protein